MISSEAKNRIIEKHIGTPQGRSKIMDALGKAMVMSFTWYGERGLPVPHATVVEWFVVRRRLVRGDANVMAHVLPSGKRLHDLFNEAEKLLG